MGRKRADNTLVAFYRKNIQDGVTYAEAQIRETRSGIGKIRAPRGEDGAPIYMKVSARNTLKDLGKGKRKNEKTDRDKQ